MRIIIFLLITVLFPSILMAQAPQGINYQAVIRDLSGNTINNSTVGIRVNIRQNSGTGTIVYSESFTPTTNNLGLVNFVIGQGNVLSGTFSSINWSTGVYFCELALDPNGGTSYTPMGSQQLVSVPYALYAETSGSGGGGGGTLDNAYDFGGSGAGRTITADNGPVQINGSGNNTAALGILFTGIGNSINAVNNNSTNQFSVIQAQTNSTVLNNSAIFGTTTGTSRGVVGQVEVTASADVGVRGQNLRTNGGIGVEGEGVNGVSGLTTNNQGFGVFGQNNGVPNVGSGFYAVGVAGIGGVGVQGQTTNGQLPGILGQNLNAGATYNNIGVYGQSTTGIGVWGECVPGNFFGVYANGDLGASGLKPFMIDHPSDPANKFLRHFSIESDQVLNMYRGIITCDANGEAIVSLEDYVELININYSYHLTPIGQYAQLYIKEKMMNGKFIIAGGEPGMEVSWQLIGERNDPYMQAFPEKRNVIVEKREGVKGTYLIPSLYGQSDDKKMNNINQSTLQIKR